MKKSIVTLGILALTIFNLNAKEVNTTSNSILNPTTEISGEMNRNMIVEVFDWSVTTEKGNYAGTSLSYEVAQKMIALVTQEEVVLSKSVESYYQLASELANRNSRKFVWAVATTNGNAKGYASTEFQAKKMIALVSTGEVVSFKIIENKKK